MTTFTKGTIRIGLPPMAGANFFPNVMSQFRTPDWSFYSGNGCCQSWHRLFAGDDLLLAAAASRAKHFLGAARHPLAPGDDLAKKHIPLAGRQGMDSIHPIAV